MTLPIARAPQDRPASLLPTLSYTLLLILVLATPFIQMSGQITPAQQTYRIYAYLVVAALQAVLVAQRGWRQSLDIVKTPALLFLAWCAFSLLWSQHFGLTGKRLLLLSLVYAGIFAGVCDLGSRRSLTILRLLLALLLGLNFLVVFVAPDTGTQQSQGIAVWCGFMAHKNIAGMLCAATVILFAFAGREVPWAARLAVIGGALIFLYQTWSKTAWLCLPLSMATGGAILLLSRKDRTFLNRLDRPLHGGALALFGLIFAALALATLQRDLFLSLTNDTTALTTRVGIWRPMLQYYLDNPLLGSGYGAYWDVPTGLARDTAPKTTGVWKDVDQGHNGYLDLLVQVGLPGLMLALYAALVWPLRQLIRLTQRHPNRSALVTALLAFILMENFSESSLFADDALGNGLLMFAMAQFQVTRLRNSASRSHEVSANPTVISTNTTKARHSLTSRPLEPFAHATS